jgi:hypothetical protein
MGKQGKIRMQQLGVEISGRKISDSGQESRNGRVSRADK